MKLAPAAWGVAATFALGLVGLLVPGPAGDIAAYVWLGVFPGLALARLLMPGSPALTRWTLGLALSPLTASVAGWALLTAGQPLPTAARIVAMGGWLLYAGGEARGLRASADRRRQAAPRNGVTAPPRSSRSRRRRRRLCRRPARTTQDI